MMRTRADGWPVTIVPDAHYMARLHARLHRRMPVWTIYRPITREYPGVWVARMHVILPALKPTRFVMTHDSLEELRGILPPGLVRLATYPGELPEIEETWA